MCNMNTLQTFILLYKREEQLHKMFCTNLYFLYETTNNSILFKNTIKSFRDSNVKGKGRKLLLALLVITQHLEWHSKEIQYITIRSQLIVEVAPEKVSVVNTV